MARNERYVTTIELNSQQAQDRLKELVNRVAELKKQKAALKPGEWFDDNALKKASRELRQWKAQMQGVQGVLDNINDVSLEQLNKTLKKLRSQKMKFLPDSDEYKEAERGILAIENRIAELKDGTKVAREESERLAGNLANLKNVLSNIKSASLNDLTSAQKYLEDEMAKSNPESTSYGTAAAQLKEVKARIQEIKAEQKEVVHQIDRYDEEIKQSAKDMKTVERETKLVNTTLSNLNTASVRDLEYSIKIINEQMRDSKRGERYFTQLQEKAKLLRTELERTRFESQAQQSLLNRTADFFNKIQGAAIAAVGAITGLTFTIRRCVEAYASMDQEMENVRKYTGQTTEEIHSMNEEFKQLDTRTPRERLNQLAGDAGRLGITSQEAVMDFVDAADKINVALGDDLGDDAVKNIGKLAMSFGTDKQMGLRGAMLATGSAINELSQNSSSAANYLVDFTARVAGFGKQIGLTQTQIMGYGAVMDENMLQDEMAATAFGQMLVKMTTDLETFAKITGMKVSEYRKLVTEDINGAVLAVAKSLKGRDMEELGKIFDAMNLNGQRAIGVLSTLGQKVEDVEKRQKIANDAFNEGTSIITEYNIQNETVLAGIEKAKKHFQDLSIELGEKLLPIARYGITTGSAIVRLLSLLIDFVGKYKTTIISLTAMLAAYIAMEYKDLAVKKLMAFWNTKLIVGTKALFATIKAHPFLALASVITTVVGLIIDMNKETEKTITNYNDISEAEKEAAKSMAAEKAKLDMVYSATQDVNTSLEKRKYWIGELRKSYPKYFADMTDEQILAGKAADAYKKLTEEIIAAAKARAYQDKISKIAEENVDIESDIEKQQDWLKQNKGKYDKNKESSKKTGVGTRLYQGQYGGGSTGTEDAFITKYEAATERVLENQHKIEENEKRIEKLAEKVKENTITNGADTGSVDPITKKPFVNDKELEKKNKKEEARQQRVLKGRNKALKAQVEMELAIETNRYAKGEIDYRTYVKNVDAIQMEGLEKRMALYNQESDEYKKLLNDREQLALKSQERQERLSLQELERKHNVVSAGIESSFYDPENSERYLNEVAVNEALYQADIEYLQEKASLYQKGSEERALIEEEIEAREIAHRLESERNYHNMLQQVREQFLNTGNEEMMAIALNGLDALHEKGLLKEKEYQEAKLAIQAQYANKNTPTEQTQNKAANMLTVASSKAKEQVGDGAYTPFAGSIKMYMSTMEQLKTLYASDEQNHAAYLAAKMQATSQFCTQLASEMQTAYNGINQIMSAASSYYAAQSEYEIAVTKKKYDAQISAAGNNKRKVKKLQEQQAKEEAAIKTKYNRKQVRIQIAQALAQTAMNALSAYGSAAAIPVVGYIMAPIAAALAIAAGMIQVAAIKKQAEAQEAGYYEGGYTGGKRYKKEAGVVHEGEFVANHQAVNNPNIRPMLDFIDSAQRNNTVGSLTKYDLARNMGAGEPTVVAPVVNVNSNNEELRDTLTKMKESVDGLNRELEKGIKTLFVMDDFEKEHKHYEIMKNR